MLELRPSCERCDRDLPPASPDARICSFECTFCAPCTDGPLAGICPNCTGNLTPRPIRPPRYARPLPCLHYSRLQTHLIIWPNPVTKAFFPRNQSNPPSHPHRFNITNETNQNGVRRSVPKSRPAKNDARRSPA